MTHYRLISHHLCPYVQRVAIALAERHIGFEREYVDLGNKPGWFTRISPLGKVPLLQAGEAVLFESAVILEYLEEVEAPGLHPTDPLRRAEHRGWMEFGSAVLSDIAGLYNAADAMAFNAKEAVLTQKFARLETRLAAAPWFDGADFSLVDAVFAPVFRYFDVFEALGVTQLLMPFPKIARWREALAARPSVIAAVTADYPARLTAFLQARGSQISQKMAA